MCKLKDWGYAGLWGYADSTRLEGASNLHMTWKWGFQAWKKSSRGREMAWFGHAKVGYQTLARCFFKLFNCGPLVSIGIPDE